MKKPRSIVYTFLVLVLVSICLGAPTTPAMEDDEYDDDPVLPIRKEAEQEAIQRLQEQLQNYQDHSPTSSPSPKLSTTTTEPTTTKPDVEERPKPQLWEHAKHVRGYAILSDGPLIETEIVKTRPMLRIKVDIPDTARDVEKAINSRSLELKIRGWNRVSKIHVKVPFGYRPEDLRVAEGQKHIDIIAPIYSDFDENK